MKMGDYVISFGALLGLTAVLLLALAAGGCADTRPVEQCLSAAGAFHAAEIAADAAVYSEQLGANAESQIKAIAVEGRTMTHTCRDSATNADSDQVKFATGFLSQAVLQLTPLLLPEGTKK